VRAQLTAAGKHYIDALVLPQYYLNYSNPLDPSASELSATYPLVENAVRSAILSSSPSGAVILNFIPGASPLIPLLFSSAVRLGMSPLRFPIVSFFVTMQSIQSAIALGKRASLPGLSSYSNHLFTAVTAVDTRKSADIDNRMQSAYGSSVLVDVEQRAVYSALTAWGAAVKEAASYDGDRVRFALYSLSNKGSIEPSIASSNYANNIFQIYQVPTSSRLPFSIVFPTLQTSLFSPPFPPDGSHAFSCDLSSPLIVVSYSPFARILVTALCVICLFVLLILLLDTYIHRHTSAVKRYSAPFCVFTQLSLAALSLGGMIMVVEPTQTNHICMSRIWLLALAVVSFCSSLFSKMYRLHRIFNNKQIKMVQFSNKQLTAVSFSANSCMIIILSLWSALDPPVYYSAPSLSLSTYNTIQATPQCTESSPFAGSTYVFVFSLLSWGLYIAFKTRNIPDQFNESRPVVICISLMLFFGCVLLPLNYLIDGNTASGLNALLVVRGVGVQCCVLIFTCILFYPLTQSIHFPSSHGASNHSTLTLTHGVKYRAGAAAKQRDATAATNHMNGPSALHSPDGFVSGLFIGKEEMIIKNNDNALHMRVQTAHSSSSTVFPIPPHQVPRNNYVAEEKAKKRELNDLTAERAEAHLSPPPSHQFNTTASPSLLSSVPIPLIHSPSNGNSGGADSSSSSSSDSSSAPAQ
jgi:hypothetical protein